MADTKINTVKKVGKILLVKNPNAANRNTFVESWKKYGVEILYTKYNIKETDMRIKTATFTSPNYIDLTTGQYFVRISSLYHENFSGVILDVEYDPSDGLYTYQCQDWSRTYIEKTETVSNISKSIYDYLVAWLTRLQIDKIPDSKHVKKKKGTYTKSQRDVFKNTLSGLRPIGEYDQSLYEGNKYKGNPFKNKPRMVIRDKTYIEKIRDVVFGSLGFFDIWFNDKGILQIEPISKTDWETTGLHLTTGNALKQKYKFSTTNAITTVKVNGSGTEFGKNFNIGNVNKSSSINLAAFFGWVGTSISDPTQKNTTSASKSTSNATKTNTKTTTGTTKDNPYGTKKKEIWITIDNIYSKSSDAKFMNDFAAELRKSGWTCHVGGVGPSYHYAHAPGYSWSGKVWNAVWFVIYGGACAGTLNEAATARWYRKPLVDRGSRTVVGFVRPPCGDIRKGGKYYSWLPRAHDDNFSPASFKGISSPAKFLTNKGVPFMYASSAKQMAQKFLQGGDNPEACTKNWKWY